MFGNKMNRSFWAACWNGWNFVKLKFCNCLNRIDSTFSLKVQSCKLYNNKYTIASTQIANTEIFASIAVLVFKLLGCEILFMNIIDNRNY